jgi:hypothetical protein
MSIENELRQQAFDIAQLRLADLLTQRRRAEQLTTELAEAEARVENLKRIADRSKSFQPKIGSDYACPRCWVENEIRSSLKPSGSESDEDWWRCTTCKSEFVTPS